MSDYPNDVEIVYVDDPRFPFKRHRIVVSPNGGVSILPEYTCKGEHWLSDGDALITGDRGGTLALAEALLAIAKRETKG